MLQKSPTQVGQAHRPGGTIRVSHKDVWPELEPGDESPVATGSNPVAARWAPGCQVPGAGVRSAAGIGTTARLEWTSSIRQGTEGGKFGGKNDICTAFASRVGKKSEMQSVMNSAFYRPAIVVSTNDMADADSIPTSPVSNTHTVASGTKGGGTRKNNDELSTAVGAAKPSSRCQWSHRMADSVQSIGFDGLKTPKNGQSKSVPRNLHRSKSDIDLSNLFVQRALDAHNIPHTGRSISGEWNEGLKVATPTVVEHVSTQFQHTDRGKLGGKKTPSRWERYVKRLPLIRSLLGSEGWHSGKERGPEPAHQENPRLV